MKIVYVSRFRRVRKISLGLLAFAIGSSGAFAQDDDTGDEVFTLSPFTVTSEDDTGYRASSTLAGTRLRSKLEDVSASISVVTEEFLEDTASTDAKDLLVYTLGTEVAGPGGNFSASGISTREAFSNQASRQSASAATRLRGLDAADVTRDYFLSDIPFDSYNTSRIDISRGANSMLFGLGSPAGIINNTTKSALLESASELELRYGSYGSNRVSLDVNRVLLPDRLGVRVIGLRDEEKYEQKPAFERDERLFGAFVFNPKEQGEPGLLGGMTLRGNVEAGNLNANRPRILPPGDQVTAWFEPFAPGETGKFTWDPANTPFRDRNNRTTGAMNPLFRNPHIVFPDHRSGVPLDAGADADDNIIGRQGVLSNWTFPGGATTTAVFAGIERIDNALRRAGNPDRAFFVTPSISDPSVFDFRGQLLDGPNKYENADFSAFNLALEQRFLDGNAGLELVVDQQRMEEFGYTLYGDGRQSVITVDINTTLIDGTANPHFGRPYVTGTGRNNYRLSERESYRATGHYELDFGDASNDALAGLLGRHVFTLLYNSQEIERQFRDGLSAYAGPEYVFGSSSSRTNGNGKPFAAIHYLGDSLESLSSSAGANIPALQGARAFDQATITGNDAVFALRGQSAGDPYVIMPLTVVTNDEFVSEAPSGASKSRQEIDSYAVNLQSFLLDELLVGVVGWRRDEVASFAGTAPAGPEGTVLVDESVFLFDPDLATSQKEDTWSWGLSLDAPDFLVDGLPWLDRVTLYYNDSSNFQPSGARFDIFGDPVGPPEGTTSDKGIGFSLFEGKLVVRATWYESDQVNVSEDAISALPLRVVDLHRRVIEQTREGNNPDPNGDNVPLESGYIPPPQGLLDRFGFEILPDGSPAIAGATGVGAYTERSSEGFELELAYNPNENWRFALNAAQQESQQDNSGEAIRRFFFEQEISGETLASNWTGAVGDSLVVSTSGTTVNEEATQRIVNPYNTVTLQDGASRQEIREWRVNAVANYLFSDDSQLSGWGVGGALRWQDEAAIGFPNTDGPEGRIVDVANPFFGPSESNLDLWISHERVLANDSIDWKIQLNVRNALGEEDLIPVRSQPDGSIGIYRIPEGRTFELTSTFSF